MISHQQFQMMRKRKRKWNIILLNSLKNKWMVMTIDQKIALVKKIILWSSWITSPAIVWWIMKMGWQRKHDICLLFHQKCKMLSVYCHCWIHLKLVFPYTKNSEMETMFQVCHRIKRCLQEKNFSSSSPFIIKWVVSCPRRNLVLYLQ